MALRSCQTLASSPAKLASRMLTPRSPLQPRGDIMSPSRISLSNEQCPQITGAGSPPPPLLPTTKVNSVSLSLQVVKTPLSMIAGSVQSTISTLSTPVTLMTSKISSTSTYIGKGISVLSKKVRTSLSKKSDPEEETLKEENSGNNTSEDESSEDEASEEESSVQYTSEEDSFEEETTNEKYIPEISPLLKKEVTLQYNVNNTRKVPLSSVVNEVMSSCHTENIPNVELFDDTNGNQRETEPPDSMSTHSAENRAPSIELADELFSTNIDIKVDSKKRRLMYMENKVTGLDYESLPIFEDRFSLTTGLSFRKDFHQMWGCRRKREMFRNMLSFGARLEFWFSCENSLDTENLFQLLETCTLVYCGKCYKKHNIFEAKVYPTS